MTRHNDGTRVERMDEWEANRTREQSLAELQTVATLLEESPVKRATASQALKAEKTSVVSVDIVRPVDASRNVRPALPVLFSDVFA